MTEPENRIVNLIVAGGLLIIGWAVLDWVFRTFGRN